MKRINVLFAFLVLALMASSQAMAQTAISGTKTVGTGGDYSNIKLAFDAINTNGISGDVVLQVISDQTLTASATLESFGTSGSVTIYPTGNYEISGSLATSYSGIIQFDGCSNVVLDGSLNGTGTDRSLWINNTTNSSSGVKFLGSTSDITVKNCRISASSTTSNASSSYGIRIYYNDGYANNITIDNNWFSASYYGVYVYGTSTQRQNNITVSNNLFDAPYMYYGSYMYYVSNLNLLNNVLDAQDGYTYYALYNYYVQNGNFNGNTVIGSLTYNANYYYPYYGLHCYYPEGDLEFNNNNISQVQYGMYIYYNRSNGVTEVANNTLNKLGQYGIYTYRDVSYSGTYDIHNNTISNIDCKGYDYQYTYNVGMWLGYVNNSDIYDNHVYNLIKPFTGTGSYHYYTAGIMIYGSSYTDGRTDNNRIYHNRIHSITAKAIPYYYSTYNYLYAHYSVPTGILLYNARYTEIYQNTINMDLPFTAGGEQGGISACITDYPYYQSSQGTVIKNNILSNTMVGSGTSTYCIYQGKHATSTTSSNSSNIAVSDYNAMYCPLGSIAYNEVTNTTYAYLSSWQSAGYGANSTDTEIDLTWDCHVDGNAAISDDLLCPQLTEVTISTDIDGEERTATNNRMGVDVTNFTLELTNDLIVDPDKPEGLCEGTQQVQFLFGAGGQFNDGIDRELGSALQTQWYKDGMPIIDTDIDNITISGNRLIINDLEVEDAGEYYARFWAMDLEPISTSTKTITVVEPVSIVSENMVEKYIGCEGFNDLTLSVETLNSFTVQWQKEVDGIWEDIEGATGSEFTLDFTEMTKEEADGKYRAKVIGDELCEPKYPSVLYTDTETEVELYLPVANETMEYYFDTENLCGGMDLEFYATADGSVRGYQWQKYQGGQWYDITAQENPTAVTQNFKLTNINETYTGAYRCKVQGNSECYDLEVFTEQVEFIVPPTFELLENPESQVICGGEEVRFQVIGNGLGEIHSYQWYKDGQRISTTENEYADDAMLIIDEAGINNVGQYYCEIEVEDCRGELTFTSESAILYVLQETKITRQPQSTEVALGDKAILAVEAHMKGLVPPYYQHDFQWYKGGQALVDDARIQGSKSSMLTINNVEAGDLSNDYYVIVKGQCGTDESVRVSISDVPTVSITMNPADVETCEGSAAMFTASAKSTDVTIKVDYQWYFNGTALVDGGEIKGATTNKLEISNVMPAHAGQYSLEAKLNGTTEMATSKAASLDVNLKPVYLTMPGADISVETDAELKLEVTVDSESDVTYQWFKDGNVIAGATESTYTVDMVKYADAGDYYCLTNNDCGEKASDMTTVTVTKKTEDPNSVFEQAGSGYALLGNQPNPFEASTTIKFELPTSTNVKITLMDASGRQLGVIFNGMAQAGENSVDLDATDYNLSSGTYFYTVEADGAAAVKAMILVK